jgi:hypothetical protein
MELLLVLAALGLIILLYYRSNPETYSNSITVVKNGPNISFFFDNENKSKTCDIKIIDPKTENVLKEVQLDLDPSDKFGRYDLSLLELKAHVDKKLKTEIKIGDNVYHTKFKLKLDEVSKTEKVMCHADGSISLGNCDAEDIMPDFDNFFSEEKKQQRDSLMKRLKKRKSYKIII